MYFRAKVLKAFCLFFLLLPSIAWGAGKPIEIQPIEAGKASSLIQSVAQQHKPLLVFMYASWCTVCKQNFPYVLKMAQQHGSKLNVIALSMDTDRSAMQRYLESYSNFPLTPYMVQQYHTGDFVKAMNQIGIKYHNAVPYTVVYDHKGKLVGQGGILVSSILPAIDKLVKTSEAQAEKH